MIGETNAAIEGALAGGATEVLVNDSHWRDVQPAARPSSIPRRALLQGQKAWSMVAGASRTRRRAGFDVALFVGYHARAGHPRGTIAHTYSRRPVETRLDGRPTGEYGVNALVLGAWGIPVGLVAGDDALAEEVADWLPWAERVVVKDGGRRRQRDLGPPDGRPRPGPGRRRARPSDGPIAGELRTARVPTRRSSSRSTSPRGVLADHAAMVPGAERVGDRGVRFAVRRPGDRVPRLPRRASGWRAPSTEPRPYLRPPSSPGRATGRAARSEVPVTPPLPRARPRDLGVRIGIAAARADELDRRRRERPGRARDGLARRAAAARRPRRSPGPG